MRRLHPDPAETTLEDAFTGLDLPALAPPGRPYVICNLVVTLDGHATIGGRSGPIGSRVDMEALHLLRTQGDAVMIGAGTMRAERYGRMLPGEDHRALRERLGLDPDPLAVIVTESMELPWDAGLFTSGAGEVVLVTGSTASPPRTETPVHVLRHEGRVDLGAALGELRERRGVRAITSEGGPTLLASMVADHLLDELFLTVAPRIAGGGGPRPLEGELPGGPIDAELVSLHGDGDELFTRWRLSR